MLKWGGVIVCLVLFVPPFIWDWCHEIVFMCQLVAGVWTVHRWLVEAGEHRRRTAMTALGVTSLVLLAVWGVSLVAPFAMSYIGRTTAINVQCGEISIAWYLGEGPQAAAACSATRGFPVYMSKAAWGTRLQVLGVVRATLADLVASLTLPRRWQMIRYCGGSGGGAPFVGIYTPLWSVIALLSGPMLVIGVGNAWRRRRASRPGCCQKCGYDLRGNMSGVCPECGMALGGTR